MDQKSVIAQEIKEKIKNRLFLNHIPSDQQIIDFLKIIDGSENNIDILVKARECFTNQQGWIETKSQQDDLKVLLMTIKRDLGL